MKLTKKVSLVLMMIPGLFSGSTRELLGMAAHADTSKETVAVTYDYFYSESFAKIPLEQQLTVHAALAKLARIHSEAELTNMIFTIRNGQLYVIGAKGKPLMHLCAFGNPTCA